MPAPTRQSSIFKNFLWVTYIDINIRVIGRFRDSSYQIVADGVVVRELAQISAKTDEEVLAEVIRQHCDQTASCNDHKASG